MKQKLSETENQRIGKSAPEFSVLEHRFKMQQSHPGTVPQAHIIAVIAKRQRNASHGQITKNNIPQENWQQQRIQHPVIFSCLQTIRRLEAFIPVRSFIKHSPFIPLDCSFLCVFIILSLIGLSVWRQRMNSVLQNGKRSIIYVKIIVFIINMEFF